MLRDSAVRVSEVDGGAARSDCDSRAVPPRRRSGVRSGHHRPPPVLRASLVPRIVWMLVGFALISAGIVVMLRSEVGLASWDVLHQGVAERTGLRFGTANVVVGVLAAAVVVGLGGRREIGLATLANMLLIGVFIDLILLADPLADLDQRAFAVRLLAGFAGTAIAGVGFALYIAAGFGTGPRDALMMLIARRAHTRIWVARTALELTVLAIGLGLGGTAGAGHRRVRARHRPRDRGRARRAGAHRAGAPGRRDAGARGDGLS